MICGLRPDSSRTLVQVKAKTLRVGSCTIGDAGKYLEIAVENDEQTILSQKEPPIGAGTLCAIVGD